MRCVIVIGLALACAPARAAPPNLIYITDPPYSAACNNTADDTAAFRAAIAKLEAGVGGSIVVPGPCKITGTLYITGSVCLVGLNATTSSINAVDIDIEMLHFATSASNACVEKISIYGYQSATAGNNVVRVDANALVHFRDCQVWGGFSALYDSGVDGERHNCYFASFNRNGGPVTSQGANWWDRVKFDAIPGVPAHYAFLQGNLESPPTALAENHFINCDFSGAFDYSLMVNDGTNTAVTVVVGGVFSSPIAIWTARWTAIGGLAEIGGAVFSNSPITIADSFSYGDISVTGIGPRRCSNNFNITC